MSAAAIAPSQRRLLDETGRGRTREANLKGVETVTMVVFLFCFD
jgi:hypothetical protein